MFDKPVTRPAARIRLDLSTLEPARRASAVGLIEQLVLRCYDLPVSSLIRPTRGQAAIAFARQVAIYLIHTHLGLSQTATARHFRRDRTTVAHACRLVEDRRDRREVDAVIQVIESAIATWSRTGTAQIDRKERLQ